MTAIILIIISISILIHGYKYTYTLHTHACIYLGLSCQLITYLSHKMKVEINPLSQNGIGHAIICFGNMSVYQLKCY